MALSSFAVQYSSGRSHLLVGERLHLNYRARASKFSVNIGRILPLRAQIRYIIEYQFYFVLLRLPSCCPCAAPEELSTRRRSSAIFPD
jgi:hypothetical protein